MPSNAEMTVSTVQTTDATQTTVASIAVPEDVAVTVQAIVTGAIDDYSATVSRNFSGAFRRASGGDVTLVGALTGGATQEDSSGTPAITMQADTTAQAVDVDVTGIAAETWNWRCYLIIVSVDE